jgi:hypothetical protein
MQLVQTVTVGSGGASSIEFTSIPQDGTDLVLVISGRITAAVADTDSGIRFNGQNLGTNRWLIGNGSTATSSSPYSNAIGPVYVQGSTTTANTFSSSVYYISNYASNQNKSISFDNVTENNATAARQLIGAGSWASTNAITSISVDSGGSSYVQHTTASLYKITKGSDGIVTTS